MKNLQPREQREYRFNWRWLDPFEVFEGIASSYAPFTLDKAYRHPQGWYIAHYSFAWDGEIRHARIKIPANCFMWHSSYTSIRGTEESLAKDREYNLHSSISRRAFEMIVGLPHRTEPIHIAQNLILNSLLYYHSRNCQSWSWEWRGSGNREYQSNLSGGHITIKKESLGRDGHKLELVEKFTIKHIECTILDQLKPEPKQLSLFAA